MIKHITIALVCALLVPAPQAGAAKAREPVFVLVPKSVIHPYWARCKKGMEAAAKELGVKAIFDGPVTNDLAKQIQIVEGYITRRVTGIAISPNDPQGIEEVIKKAVRRGIPVVTFDSDAPGSKRAMYIGTVNREAGREAGRALVKALKGKGKVAILHGSVTALNLRKRLEGFKEVVDEEEGITLVALEENRDDAALAMAQAENILQRYPKLDAFFATSAPGGPAAVAALRSKGKAGRVVVIGFDLDKQNVKAIKKGWMTAVIEQRPFKMGELAVQWLQLLAQGEKPESRILDTGVTVVTKENVKEAAALL